MSAIQEFHWEPQPEAQKLVDELVATVVERCAGAATLAKRMVHDTGTRLKDWLDTITALRTPALRARLLDVGFERRAMPGAPDCFVHQGGLFPRIVLEDRAATRLFVKVDSVIDFLSAWHIADDPRTATDNVEGDPASPMRQARAFMGDGAEVWVVERHGYRGFVAPKPDAERAMLRLRHIEVFRRRARDFDSDSAGLDHVDRLVDAAIADLGEDVACAAFFEAEREYWLRRNRAAQVQKSRQDKLGLGWANHDHHTYRSSRECFTRLVALFEKLGFKARERFYAGEEAGWGAQVLEQPEAGITIFADVDLSPEEVLGNFAHEPLEPRKELGTVGLWCGLHGEAILQAGMHHLECQFDFEALKDQLEAAHIDTMDPFTSFPYLRQAFTAGERWPVAEKRIARLLSAGLITPAQAAQFRAQGAIGSHLENLERNDGFKGFNQKGISEIISKTDPRRQAQLIGA
ncbi:MAG: hypothetical protein JNM80_11310 [Phycisphaerae bacterium]|nr:hypothetical protein [Phycisphaerae bacterium]